MTTPHIIGIAGPSGSGKSYLAHHLSVALGGAPVLTLDSYYPDLSHLPPDERAGTNFDDPNFLDHRLLISHIRDLANGNPIQKPIYDFATHTRTGNFDRFEPARHVLVEGLYALYWPDLREFLSTKIYVDLTDEICLARRLERDMRERGRSRESVLRQYRETVALMADRHVRPSARFADIVVSGDVPVAESVRAVLRQVLRGPQKPAFPGSAV